MTRCGADDVIMMMSRRMEQSEEDSERDGEGLKADSASERQLDSDLFQAQNFFVPHSFALIIKNAES